jgi:outer membrane protein, heavy metal efflux system
MRTTNTSIATSSWPSASPWRPHGGGIAAIAAALTLFLLSGHAHAQHAALTRQRVAELVRIAPATRVAQLEAKVSEAAVTAAGVLSLENPVVSGMGGVRFNPDGSRPFNGVATLSWPVDIGGKHDARVEAAKAEYRAATASAAGDERRLLLGALLQHQLVLLDERQVAIAAARHALSERVYAAAQRRHAAGGVPELDVALAAMQEKRDAPSKATALGSRDADKLVLATLLGLSTNPAVEGSLVPEGEPPPLAMLIERADQRPDVRAATAAVEAAQAKSARERATRWPTINVLAQYERDDGANIGLLGLAVPIPVLNANRVEVATTAAEVNAAKARVTQSRTAAGGHIKELYARYLATKAATDSLAPTAALATRAVTLATRGYELGENDLASVLLVRREAIESEAALLEAQHAHAAVKLELLVTAGKVPQ